MELKRPTLIEEVFYKTLIANTFSIVKCSEPPYDQRYNLTFVNRFDITLNREGSLLKVLE